MPPTRDTGNNRITSWYKLYNLCKVRKNYTNRILRCSTDRGKLGLYLFCTCRPDPRQASDRSRDQPCADFKVKCFIVKLIHLKNLPRKFSRKVFYIRLIKDLSTKDPLILQIHEGVISIVRPLIQQDLLVA